MGTAPRIIEAGTPAVRSATFHLPGAVSGVQIKPKYGVGALYAPRRTILDAILADAARSAGADVRFGTSVTGLWRDRAGRVTGITGRAGAGRLEARADLRAGHWPGEQVRILKSTGLGVGSRAAGPGWSELV